MTNEDYEQGYRNGESSAWADASFILDEYGVEALVKRIAEDFHVDGDVWAEHDRRILEGEAEGFERVAQILVENGVIGDECSPLLIEGYRQAAVRLRTVAAGETAPMAAALAAPVEPTPIRTEKR